MQRCIDGLHMTLWLYFWLLVSQYLITELFSITSTGRVCFKILIQFYRRGHFIAVTSTLHQRHLFVIHRVDLTLGGLRVLMGYKSINIVYRKTILSWIETLRDSLVVSPPDSQSGGSGFDPLQHPTCPRLTKPSILLTSLIFTLVLLPSQSNIRHSM